MADSHNSFGFPASRNEPAPSLTCWEALGAIRARVHFPWNVDDPDYKKAGVMLPNLGENIRAILAITIAGEGSPPQDPVDPLERFKGRPLSESLLSTRVKNLLLAANVSTLYYFMKLTSAEADAISGVGRATILQIVAEQARLSAL